MNSMRCRIVSFPGPNLPAAVVGKAKASLRLESPDRHRQDLAFLLGLVEEPVDVAALLSPTDRRTVVRAGIGIEESGFWSSANDEQAARAILRIIEGAE